jgi:thymidylate synthase
VGNKPKQQVKDRRARVEELRRQQRAAERRKTVVFVSVAILIAAALIAVPGVQFYLNWRNDPARRDFPSFGVAASAASCDPITTDPAAGVNEHVPPGTRLRYATVPPTSGKHWPVPATISDRAFYTAEDRPPVEQLVHNLEHGYTVLWYDASVQGKQLDEIRDLAKKLRGDPKYQKFIAVAWDPAYGKLPSGKTVALSHWSAGAGHRQLCGQLSGAVVKSFMDTYPASDTPEPNAP